MTKLIALITAGSFAATTLIAAEHGEGLRNVQNEKKEMKMACSIPLGDLNLTPEQMKKMNTVMAEHMKTEGLQERLRDLGYASGLNGTNLVAMPSGDPNWAMVNRA